jgi:hypothetical protein
MGAAGEAGATTRRLGSRGGVSAAACARSSTSLAASCPAPSSSFLPTRDDIILNRGRVEGVAALLTAEGVRVMSWL